MARALCWIGFHSWRRAGMVRVFAGRPMLLASTRECRRCGRAEWWHEWRVNASPKWVRMTPSLPHP